MKIALVHCYYRQRGGEDVVFEQECELLQKVADVSVLTFKNKTGIRGLIHFILSFHNISIGNLFTCFLKNVKPDIIHIHNWHYSTGPVIIRIAKKHNIPVVMTLHNYRLICPSATLISKGKIFTYSLFKSFPWSAVIKGVYRDSVFLTFWMAFIVWWNKKRGTWKMVTMYIVVSESAKSLFLKSSLGIDPYKLVVKPNFTKAHHELSEIIRKPNQFLFVGRLVEEKGVNVLLEAFSTLNCTLIIAGEGPLLDKVDRASQLNKNILYVGKINRLEMEKLMRESEALIFPSIWYEPFGLVMIEAFAVGCAVIASDIGAAAEIVTHGLDGLHFKSGNASDLKQQIKYWLSISEDSKKSIRANSNLTYQKLYTPAQTQAALLHIYESALNQIN